jgi:hypothetical protein
MKRYFLSVVLVFSLTFPKPSFGFFGNPADTAALLQILATTLKQLIELKNMVDAAETQVQMFKDLNSGIDHALGLIETHYPNKALDLYRDWQTVSQSHDKLEAIYGVVVKSKDELAQKHMDQSIVDAVLQNNETLQHADRIDLIGEAIIEQSAVVSPKGAARLTAEALGVGLQAQNQSLRLQSSSLKLEAQRLANENKKEKEETKMFLETSGTLKKAMDEKKNNYKTPRFQ